MTHALTVQNAEIKTAAVEIRTLTVSGKQVTLAVFRQLLEADIVDFRVSHELRGEPWGRVNYHADKMLIRQKDCLGYWLPDRLVNCAQGPNHLHVVWQLGSELRRALVRHPKESWKDVSEERRAVDRAAWESLQALPHLFIAV